MSYQEKYFKYKNKYLNLKKQVGGNKFKVGDTVKRVGSSWKEEGSDVEALGMVGIIKNITESSEWPPQSGRILPKLYFISFPDLYKGTEQEGTLLGVVEEDLELVGVVVVGNKFKKDDRFYYNKSINDIPNPTGTVLHKRDAYGDTLGGTYFVKYDDP